MCVDPGSEDERDQKGSCDADCCPNISFCKIQYKRWSKLIPRT